MIVREQLQITSEEYFDFILDLLIADLKKDFKKKLTIADIKTGLSYKRKYKLPKGDFVSKKTIDEYEYGRVYSIMMETPDGVQYLIHRAEPLGDNEIEVTYEERLETSKASTKLYYSFRSRGNKKMMRKRLKAIEQEIISNR